MEARAGVIALDLKRRHRVGRQTRLTQARHDERGQSRVLGGRQHRHRESMPHTGSQRRRSTGLLPWFVWRRPRATRRLEGCFFVQMRRTSHTHSTLRLSIQAALIGRVVVSRLLRSIERHVLSWVQCRLMLCRGPVSVPVGCDSPSGPCSIRRRDGATTAVRGTCGRSTDRLQGTAGFT